MTWYDSDVCGATGACDGLGSSWYRGMGQEDWEGQLPSCPQEKQAGWLNQVTIDRGQMDPRCSPTDITRDPGTFQRAVCCDQSFFEELNRRRLTGGMRLSIPYHIPPGGVQRAGGSLGAMVLLFLGGAVVVTGSVLTFRRWKAHTESGRS